MEHFDYLGVGGLLVGLLGLAVAFYAIRDVRKLVREQVALDRNRLYARLGRSRLAIRGPHRRSGTRTKCDVT